MGFFTDEKEDALKKCTIAQLKHMAEEKKIIAKPLFFQTTISEDAYTSTLYNSNKITLKYIKSVLDSKQTKKQVSTSIKNISVKNVAKAINDEFYITKSHDSEAEFERDFVNWARGRFGHVNVLPQYSVGRTKIDVVIGGVGVELKFPKSQRPLMTLRGQIDVYQKHFGDNLIVLLFSSKCESFAVAEFISDMKKRKITVIERK
ncbi:MAG: hypothetical protein FP824_01835 [Euryarchaeota archaeon]|nr:hypothetical protein [Euryarchaeota archaeon]MBU4145196.1 hypothetical protein [Candidatus Thermoplasmatota archaeon]